MATPVRTDASAPKLDTLESEGVSLAPLLFSCLYVSTQTEDCLTTSQYKSPSMGLLSDDPLNLQGMSEVYSARSPLPHRFLLESIESQILLMIDSRLLALGKI